ncbi:putative 1-phosphatidylinositol-3-phosphate 5-kinase FAB1C isoform X1 [Eucalyptus grandis]|uniref:putative 1-phosphatidylinositol-3-phosphate 5-kinase FAB1C isoform X1 n=1 Tax=Eucalyptus grandis TaxID=71139 RepID=UPI00192E8B25|nr:putative 1-phosphatidylinositol-3-phosphate 5-kinase FAB1C isoform X1 [Eucalyptus grandis]
MKLPDTQFLDLKHKFRFWISEIVDSVERTMSGNSGRERCCEGHVDLTGDSCRCHCQSCGRYLCERRTRGSEPAFALDSGGSKHGRDGGVVGVKYCKPCAEIKVRTEGRKKYCEKVHPRDSPEPPSPCFSSEKMNISVNSESIQSDLAQCLVSQENLSPHGAITRSMASVTAHLAPVSVHCSPSRYKSDEEAEDSGKHSVSPLSDYSHGITDIGSRSFSSRHDFYSSRSVFSTPSGSPSRINYTSYRRGQSAQHEQEGSPMSRDGPFDPEGMAVLRKPEIGTEDVESSDYCSDDLSIFRSQCETSQQPLDFENNGLIWFPPPPNDEDDEVEGNFFEYDDEDDYVGDSGAIFASSSSLSSMFSTKERQHEGNKEPLRAMVQAHFRALVSQLLHGEGIKMGGEDRAEEWIDVVANISWQAANFVKPDTSRGGSMDPCDYVKVKCVARGSPCDSALIKGVVCTKNIKHKRMTSQYKNPRILILGGALEYQRASNQLASLDTLLQQEMDHLKMIISRIEALHPNVLLVEKSVSSYAQEYLLEKEISLVLNVKKQLLERISRCTGALITPSTDSITMTTRLGHCELFRLERVSEEHETSTHSSRKPSKTLMYFEGCPRRLGCTVLLRGMCREELKKVKHVVHYAVFAAYHLSLETSFLADEGARLPKIALKRSLPDKKAAYGALSTLSASDNANYEVFTDGCSPDKIVDISSEIGGMETFCNHLSHGSLSPQVELSGQSALSDAYNDDLALIEGLDSCGLTQSKDFPRSDDFLSKTGNVPLPHLPGGSHQEALQGGAAAEVEKSLGNEENEVAGEYFSATDTNQSILVSFSSRCVLKGAVCERSRLLRIKFYGGSDKPLGRYLRDDLFDQACRCRSCNEPAEAHVLCYTHQQGNLTVNVKQVPSIKLPGEQDGRIWMWHRCLKCAHVDGVPPATPRVVMSDAAWGLSFGKFLELSFSNHATANRVATCGHSLQRDCLRFYGLGSMVAFFRYSPIDILSVHLPPSKLEFNGLQQEWLRKEAAALTDKVEKLYLEMSDVVDNFEQKSMFLGHESLDKSDLQNQIKTLKDLLKKERSDYDQELLELATMESSQQGQTTIDILEMNRALRSLIIGSRVWDRRLHTLNLLLGRNSPKTMQGDALYVQLKELRNDLLYKDGSVNVSDSSELTSVSASGFLLEQADTNPSSLGPCVPKNSALASTHHNTQEDVLSNGGINYTNTISETIPTEEPNLSERIDCAWTGSDHLTTENQPFHSSLADGATASSGHINESNSPPFRRLMSPVRVQSFDSVMRVRDRQRKGLPPSSLHLSTLGSFHASGDYRNMLRDPVSNVIRTYSQMLPLEAQKLNLAVSSPPSLIPSSSRLAEGAHLLLPQTGHNDIVIAVYDEEPTSVISYALCSKEHEDWVSSPSREHGGDWSGDDIDKDDVVASSFATWQSFGTLDFDHANYGSFGSEDALSSMGTIFKDSNKSPHLRIPFGDESSTAGGKAKFSVTCYFAKQFDSLRRKCCPSEVDFVRSLSRCRRWSAQGGKSNVYFAKSMDERFIVKQVTKTELESFEEFASGYFEYLTGSISSGSPTCLAKVLGLYQVTVKSLKGGKETKMDLMVMENLFFNRNISRVYDLKGSARARYNPDTSGKDKVLLDLNLLEALRTKPIFLGSKAKRSLERAIWNDTNFLASVDVMDYSLLVGVDDERKELVLGIIDFMRQYTWDKQLETLFKASGILGGPKNASPTIISPDQYKKRFRKAMTTYFLTIPDQFAP